MDLMAAQVSEFKEESWIERHAAFRLGIDFHHPAANAIWIKLRVPRSIERVGEIDAAPIAANFDHLRAAVQGRAGILRMSCAAHDAAEMDRTGFLGMERVGNIVLKKFPGSPAGDVK